MRLSIGKATGLCAGGIPCQPIAAIVIFVRGVALGPDPGGFVQRHEFIQFHPQIEIGYGIPVPPLAAFPARHPFRDAAAEILRVGDDLDFTWFLKRQQPLNGRHHLHAVVGGQRVVAEEFLLDIAGAQNTRPSSRAWIAQAGSVGDEGCFFHALKLLS